MIAWAWPASCPEPSARFHCSIPLPISIHPWQPPYLGLSGGWFWVLVWEVPCFALPYWCWVGEPGTRRRGVGHGRRNRDNLHNLRLLRFWQCGDEAVLAAILQQLRSLAPGSRCIVISGDPARTAEEHGVEAVHRLDITGLWSALRQGTVFISGGGTLFQDVTSSRSLYYYLLMIVFAWSFGLPVIIYGQGIGPLRSRWNRLLTLKALGLARLVIVRDRKAYEQLLAWGFDGRRLCLGSDPWLP